MMSFLVTVSRRTKGRLEHAALTVAPREGLVADLKVRVGLLLWGLVVRPEQQFSTKQRQEDEAGCRADLPAVKSFYRNCQQRDWRWGQGKARTCSFFSRHVIGMRSLALGHA